MSHGTSLLPIEIIKKNHFVSILFLFHAFVITIIHGQTLPAPNPDAINNLLGALNGDVSILVDYDVVIAADLWTDQPEILSGSPGFDGIVGVPLPLNRDNALVAGAAWNDNLADTCGPNATAPLTTAVNPILSALYFCDEVLDLDDGLPVCFSWPVLPSSISREKFLYKRSDGQQFSPKCAGVIPNFEYNERHCVVLFDDFFNRQLPDEDGYLYMEELEIIGDIQLIGPNGTLVDATGLTFTPSSPNATSYESGPVFIGSRLIPLTQDGEGAPPSFLTVLGQGIFPNSGEDIYGNNTSDGGGSDRYRLRLYYSGGMTPDGLVGLTPEQFERYFTLIFSTGQELSTTNQPLTIDGTGTSVTVLGLADVGIKMDQYVELCYQDDRDNYIDVILQVDGDATVLESTLQSFRAFEQQPGLYNPGGPGPTPFDGIRYVAPAPEQEFPIDVDLDRIREVTYCVNQNGTVSTDIATCLAWIDGDEIVKVPQGLNPVPGLLAALAPLMGGMGPGTGTTSESTSSPSDSESTLSSTSSPTTEEEEINESDGGIEPTASPSMTNQDSSNAYGVTTAAITTFLALTVSMALL